MRIEEFLSRLERTKKAGAGYQARCPAHPDKVASLSIAEGDDGRVLLKCHASCSVEDIVAKLGLEMKDLFAESGETPRPPSKAVASSYEARTEQVYDYVDEDGEILFQSVRLRDPKEFRQRHRNGEGWVWNLTDVRRVLYRLPEVLLAASEGRAVWICEGEKDADALSDLGFAATSNPMGAGKWLEEYNPYLKGCAWALVVADCDEPGRKAAHEIATKLQAAKIRVKMIDLAPDRGDGYDVFDYILEWGDTADWSLRELAREAPEGTRSAVRAPTISAREFQAKVGEYDPSREYLGPLFYGGERVHIIGPVNQGKTTFVQEALSAALHGEEFLGWKGKGAPIKGVFVDLEQPEHALNRGLTDARLFDSSLGNRFEVWHEPDGLAIDQNQQHRDMIIDLVQRFQIVVIDPWYKLIAEELSDGMRNVRPVISFLDGLRKRYPKTVIICARHTNEAERGRRLELRDASGYKAYERAADITLGFQRLGGDRSRLIWLKTRSHLLPKLGETWLVEWKRGQGFERTEGRKPTDQILDHLTTDWVSTAEVAERADRDHKYTARILNDLVFEGRAECQGSAHGGRGQTKHWRLANADQDEFDLAA